MGAGAVRMLFVQGGGERAGAESALLARVRHLRDNDIEPAVAFLTDGPFRGEVEAAGVETMLIGEAPRFRDVAKLPAVVRRIADVARRERADVLEGCGEKMSALSGWAARLVGCGCVYNLQDAPRRSSEATVVQAAAVSGRHDEVVVPSHWMARAFRRAFGLKSRVIPNALVMDALPEEPADVRAMAGWPEDSLVVGHSGRLIGWKGVDVLLRAAARVNGRTRFLIVGGPLYGAEPGIEDTLRELAENLGVAERVHFTGHRDDALALVAGCDVMTHCAVKPEPFGMVVLEAMALGKPMVATLSGGPEEMIDSGRTGVLVEPGDEHALAAELRSLLDDPERRSRLGTAAREEVERRFASTSVRDPLSSLYKDVAARRNR